MPDSAYPTFGRQLKTQFYSVYVDTVFIMPCTVCSFAHLIGILSFFDISMIHGKQLILIMGDRQLVECIRIVVHVQTFQTHRYFTFWISP